MPPHSGGEGHVRVFLRVSPRVGPSERFRSPILKKLAAVSPWGRGNEGGPGTMGDRAIEPPDFNPAAPSPIARKQPTIRL